MRPLPKQSETLAGPFTLITDESTVDEYVDKKNDAECWFDENKVVIDVKQKTIRRQWTLWCHEHFHIADEAVNLGLTEEQIEYLGAFWADLMERNGFLDEPHQRGFYEVPDIEPCTAGSCARMAEKLEGGANAKDAK